MKKQKFSEIAKEVERNYSKETSVSSLRQTNDFKELVESGEEIIPLAIEELEKCPLFLIEVLEEIVGDCPKNYYLRNKRDLNSLKLKEDWKEWFEDNSELLNRLEKKKNEKLEDIRKRITNNEKTTFAERNIVNIIDKKNKNNQKLC